MRLIKESGSSNSRPVIVKSVAASRGEYESVRQSEEDDMLKEVRRKEANSFWRVRDSRLCWLI